jgi:lysozyme family protein
MATETDFQDALKWCLEYEGGYSNDPQDLGGETNLGITHTEYDAYRRAKGLTPQSVRYITYSEAADMYRHKYWEAAGCPQMPRRIAISVFDWQVNSGRGVQLLQQLIGSQVDGVFGPKTLNDLKYYLSKHSEMELVQRYAQTREETYKSWAVGSQAVFRQGWLRRNEDLAAKLGVTVTA